MWKLPAADLLYVGAATRKRLYKLGINTIGDLAQANEGLLVNRLGQTGRNFAQAFARGEDTSPVTKLGEEANTDRWAILSPPTAISKRKKT